MAGAVRTPAAGTAYVRVNQVGYATDASKRAYLLSHTALDRTAFAVREPGGATVFAGAAGASLGPWSTRFPFVYPLDFDALTRAGRYTITAGSGTSPEFRIAPAAKLYTKPIANALAFFRNERDGPDFIPSALRRAPAHLNDGNAMTYLTPQTNSDGVFKGDLTPLGKRIDASGGWWDAGDYPKFVETTSYTVDLLLAAARDFPDEVGPGFAAEARFGTDWLERMWGDGSRTLYYQVGIGEGNGHTAGDHDIWRLPQADDAYGGSDPLYRYVRERPVFRAGQPGSKLSPNLAGRDAAAFALCYELFRTSDAAYADGCLLRAEHVFDLANTSPGKLLTVIPFDFYGETEWRDDLELGAAELALALSDATPPAGLPHRDPAFYLARAAHWARAYIDGPNDAADTLNLYDVSGLAHYELARALDRAGDPTNLEATRADLVADLERALDGALARAQKDPFDFGFPWATWDTASHGFGLSVMASEADELAGTRRYAAWSDRWLGDVLGANAWGVSLAVGDGTTFPHCLQHQVANLAGSLDGSPPVLAGAVVEGPNSFSATGRLDGMRACPPGGGNPFGRFDSKAVFRDDVEAYSNVEPAIDLTAASPLAFARQAAGRY